MQRVARFGRRARMVTIIGWERWPVSAGSSPGTPVRLFVLLGVPSSGGAVSIELVPGFSASRTRSCPWERDRRPPQCRLLRQQPAIAAYRVALRLDRRWSHAHPDRLPQAATYPSSKTCAACGHLLAGLSLSAGQWTCPCYGARHDRDVNAAKNFLAAGRAVAGGAPGDACGWRQTFVQALREALYPHLLVIACDWAGRLSRPAPWPDDLDSWLDICHQAGQARSAQIMLRHRTGQRRGGGERQLARRAHRAEQPHQPLETGRHPGSRR